MAPLKETVVEIEKRLILEARDSAGGVQSKAARKLGVSQRILGYKMKKYGIKKRREGNINQIRQGGKR